MFEIFLFYNLLEVLRRITEDDESEIMKIVEELISVWRKWNK
jgi:hypothetical protein